MARGGSPPARASLREAVQERHDPFREVRFARLPPGASIGGRASTSARSRRSSFPRGWPSRSRCRPATTCYGSSPRVSGWLKTHSRRHRPQALGGVESAAVRRLVRQVSLAPGRRCKPAIVPRKQTQSRVRRVVLPPCREEAVIGAITKGNWLEMLASDLAQMTCAVQERPPHQKVFPEAREPSARPLKATVGPDRRRVWTRIRRASGPPPARSRDGRESPCKPRG